MQTISLKTHFSKYSFHISTLPMSDTKTDKYELTRNIPDLVLENLFRHNILSPTFDDYNLREKILKTKEYFDFQVYKSEKKFDFEDIIGKSSLDLSDLINKIKKKSKRRKKKGKRN